MTIRVGMIADDLTGALDAAAPFADRGLRTKVVLSPHLWQPSVLAGAEVVCINTASREMGVDQAAQLVKTASEHLLSLEPHIVFKKVDSRLKGNLVAELGAMLAASGRSDIVLAPAIPDLGRIVRNGQVRGVGVNEPIDILTLCGQLPVSAPETADSAARQRVAETASTRAETTLLAGARGLALALAQRFPKGNATPFAAPLAQPVLVAIGSRDAITRAQVDHMTRELDPLWLRAPNGAVPTARLAPVTLVTAEPGDSVEAGTSVAVRFAQGLAGLVRDACPASMLISGGETAYAVLRQLGVTTLELGGEALPGVPFFRTLIGDRQVVILTKSGGFGTPNTISLLVGMPAELH